jgi:ribosomal protein S18 acetylase RimI-like enzyme
VVDTPDARLLDEIATNATVAPLARLVDGWLAKAAPDLPFRRSNAVLPAAGAGADHRAVAHVLDVLEAWYGSMGQRVLVQVSSADAHAGELDGLLAARGYEVEAPVDILVAATEAVAEAGERSAARLLVSLEEQHRATTDGPAGVDVTVTAGVDEAWVRGYAAVFGGDDLARSRTAAYGRMLGVLGADALAAAAHPPTGGGSPGEVIGVGFAVLERGWAGVFGMGTASDWRRRGVGGALLGALAVEAREQFAHHLYLQVETDNDAAQALYRGLGFTRSHGYRYRVSAAP